MSVPGEILALAIRNTFARRRTELPDARPSALGPGFTGDPQKNTQWKAFLSKLSVTGGAPALSAVGEHLNVFLGPPTRAGRRDERFVAHWRRGGPWCQAAGRESHS